MKALVKKVSPLKKLAPKGPSQIRRVPPKEFLSIALPTEKKKPLEFLQRYTGLIYGREKIGKTTVLASFPKTLFFTTEPGSKGLSIYEFNSEDGGVRNWEIFRAGVDALCTKEARGQFETVVIDTVDRAYDMALDWVCENRGIEYPGHDAAGEEDYGKSWRAVKQEFIEQIHRLEQAGYGIWLTSHAKETQIRTKSGDRYTRIFPTMGNQARAVIEALVDFFFYCDYMRDQAGNSLRVFFTEGDETIWAGARQTPHGRMPQFLPMKDDGTGYETIDRAFRGEDVGLKAEMLLPTKATSETARQFLVKTRTKNATEEKKASLKKLT